MERAMPDLSIKDVPDEQVEALRARAKKNHRSLQGELRALIEAATKTRRKMSIEEISAYVQSLGLTSKDEATQWIREDRDR